MKLDLKAVLKQVRKIEIVNRRVVENLLQGAYRSTFKGQGMEFADVREYVEGDDVRAIDWNVTARTGTPHVKQFQEEREMTVLLMLDASASVDFGTTRVLKRQLAVEFCASMAFSATRNHDRVGLVLFTDRIEHYSPPRKGRAHILRMIRDMIYHQPQSRGTDINCALNFLTHLVKRKSTVFLISDFLTSADYEHNLRQARYRHDVTAVVMTDRREREIPNVGVLELEDAETGQRVILDTASRKFRDQYREQASANAERLQSLFKRCRVDSVQLDTGQSYFDAVLRFFRQRQGRHW